MFRLAILCCESGVLFSPTLCHDFEIPMKLWNDHIVPDHIFLRRPGRNELKAAEEMRNEDV